MLNSPRHRLFYHIATGTAIAVTAKRAACMSRRGTKRNGPERVSLIVLCLNFLTCRLSHKTWRNHDHEGKLIIHSMITWTWLCWMRQVTHWEWCAYRRGTSFGGTWNRQPLTQCARHAPHVATGSDWATPLGGGAWNRRTCYAIWRGQLRKLWQWDADAEIHSYSQCEL